jgi:hypothetical protein
MWSNTDTDGDSNGNTDGISHSDTNGNSNRNTDGIAVTDTELHTG